MFAAWCALELFKGNCRVTGRKSDRSLYREDFATFEDDEVYSHKDAEGFIRLNAPAAAHPEDAGNWIGRKRPACPWGPPHGRSPIPAIGNDRAGDNHDA